MLAPVHDPDHDRACIGSYFYEIETRITGYLACFFDGDDADLFSTGTN
jgi:hypothetical protein